MEEQDKLIHGGDWAGFEAQYGHAPLDFSSNLSPLGVPAGVKQALIAAAGEVNRYPDPLCRKLTAAIADAEQLPCRQILCGAGAADLIFKAVLALKPHTALVTAPTFSDYEQALDFVECRTEHYLLRKEDGFGVREDILEHVTDRMDVIFLCQPNNPTGVTTPRALLQRILDRCTETGTTLILDESFASLLDDPENYTMGPALAGHPNLLILKAFTKLYAMAGVRLGYALSSNKALLDRMQKAGQYWPVSSLAQSAGLAALREQDYVEKVRKLISEQRAVLSAGLRDLGFTVIPGMANYLLFQSPTPLCKPLEERGILLRSCANYRGLDESWYRTAVRTEEENEMLLAAIREVLR